MIKGTFHQENITLMNKYAPDTGAPKYLKQLLTDLKGEINNTVIARDLNTPLTSMDRSFRQKVKTRNSGIKQKARLVGLNRHI